MSLHGKERRVTKIDVEAYRWVALRISHAKEFSAAEELTAKGFLGYCPMGRKFAIWASHKKRAPKGTIRNYPVFSRYIFCGLKEGQVVGRDTRIGVDWTLGDSSGPIYIPPIAIRHLNDLEISGEWDTTKDWREKSPYAVGSQVKITDGAFAGFQATVSALESENRIRLLIDMFGRAINVRVTPLQVSLA